MPSKLTAEQVLGILDIADNAIVSIGEDQRIVFFNQGAERIFGWRRDEVIGKELEILMPERFRAGHGRHMEGFHQGPTTARRMGERGTIYAVRKDGTEFPAEASISRLKSGSEWLLTAILQDISERRAYERELEAQKEKAEAAVRAKGVFLANMSHEIRTPLNAVIGMTSLLLNTALDEEQRDHTETIRNSGEALLSIINDLLDYSKIDAGRLDLEHQAFEVRRCVEDALDVVAPGTGGKQIELSCTIDPAVPATVLADATRLRQILVNLLSNAVKFTHSGEVLIELSADHAEGERTTLHFTVSDTGIGIPEHRLEDIFDSFTQVDASTTRQYGGTGLGLTISRRLAQIMGGTLTVESELGSGSRFVLSIPVQAVAGERAGDLLKEQAAGLAGRRVLIVDDNPTNRRILMRQALLWGMAPSAAASAAEALDLVQHGHGFDLGVLDMHMPDVDGLGLAAAIRKTEQGRALPLILLTSIGLRLRALDAGGDADALFAARLNKPVKPAVLLEALLRALGQRKQAAAPVAAAPVAAQGNIEILVAEDNAINQKVIRQQLRRLGYRADVVGNGVEVIEALERQDYGVILMDMQMPEMDGIEATRRLRRRFTGASAPYIIAMTANALPGDRERCLDAGMDAYLPKPVILDDLRTALTLGIEQAQGRRRSALVLDPARLRELDPDGDGGLAAELGAAFADEVPGLLDKAQDALRAQDAAALAAVAHYLLSSIDIIGAQRMRLHCMHLELLGRAGNLDGAQEELGALAREFDAVRAALRATGEGEGRR
jgi:PAS domain S-box-containing protein